MTITFYNYVGELNVIGKFSQLNNPVELQGTLRNGSSLLTPIIDIQYGDVPTFNYAYIKEFNRYYFVTEISSIRNNLWAIRMKVDVLESHKDNILENTAIVTRMTNEIAGTRMADKHRPMRNNKVCQEIYRHVVDMDLVGKSAPYNKIYYYLIVSGEMLAYSDSAGKQYSAVASNYSPMNHIIVYIIESVIFTNILWILANNAEINQYIIEMGIFPYSLQTMPESIYSALDKADEFYIGNVRVTEVESLPEYSTSVWYIKPTATISDDFNIDIDKDIPEQVFLDGNDLKLSLPFCGTIDLPKSVVKYEDNKYKVKFKIRSFLDLTNMTLTYSILDIAKEGNPGYDEILINSMSCTIGIKIPINRTNLSEVKRQEEVNLNNLLGNIVSGVMGMVYGFAKSFVGLSTGNIIAGASGAIDAAQSAYNASAGSAINYTNAEIQNVVSGGATFNSGSNLALLSAANRFKVLYYHYEENPDTVTAFESKYGHSCIWIGKLKELTGFTQISDIHLETLSTALSAEISEIDSLLRSGVIIKAGS